jgi:hypothetical protein
MEVAAGLIKLNPNSKSKVDEWRDTMESRMEEALATLVHEGAEIESWFRVKIDGQDYLLWYMRAESMQKVFEVSRTFKHPIDRYHYDLMDSITAPGGNIVAKPLLDLKV